MRLILASNSPRRKDLLSKAGVVFDVMAADIDETPGENETPSRFAMRMAEEKALAAANKLRPEEQVVILAADTVVTIDGKILGKPQTSADAEKMLKLLSGRTHQVITGWAILSTGTRPCVLHETTSVTFRRLADAEISDYVATGEPMDKAGAYAIQGGAAKFAEHIDGLISNVVGLPVERLVEPLKKTLVNPVE
jgi:septum formation protein